MKMKYCLSAISLLLIKAIPAQAVCPVCVVAVGAGLGLSEYFGIDRNVLVTGPTFTYPDTRAWAEKIHAACPSAQGLYYTSLQNGPEYAVVLFGDRVPQDAFEGLSTRTLVEEECHDEVCSIADSLSIDYVEV
jgi:hypothetical protein